jgi:hypothetical protein
VSGLMNGGLTIVAGSVPLEKRPALIGILMGRKFGFPIELQSVNNVGLSADLISCSLSIRPHLWPVDWWRFHAVYELAMV